MSNEERDIAKKPVKSKNPRYGMGYDYYDWECPTCGWLLAFEPAYENIPKRCQRCGQLLSSITRQEAENFDESGITIL